MVTESPEYKELRLQAFEFASISYDLRLALALEQLAQDAEAELASRETGQPAGREWGLGGLWPHERARLNAEEYLEATKETLPDFAGHVRRLRKLADTARAKMLASDPELVENTAHMAVDVLEKRYS